MEEEKRELKHLVAELMFDVKGLRLVLIFRKYRRRPGSGRVSPAISR